MREELGEPTSEENPVGTAEELSPLHVQLIVPQKNKKKIILVSVLNGLFYYAVAFEGGKSLQTLFDMDDQSAQIAISAISVGASLVYTMFTYKTYESLSFKIDSLPKGFFSILAVFAASAFLTAGHDGALKLGFDEDTALAIGLILFTLRMVNCVDASVKFPSRFLEIIGRGEHTSANSNSAEKLRLFTVWLASIIYVLCTTDSIYKASEDIWGWMGLSADKSSGLNLAAACLGAVGTLPLNVYWGYRGLRQLTYGGKINQQGINPDPTDVYTYIGLFFVLPVLLGILGGATASSGKVFGRIADSSSNALRLISSMFYAICAGTPGMASLLRNTHAYIKEKREPEENYQLLSAPLEEVETEKSSMCSSILCCFWSKAPKDKAQDKETVSFGMNS